MKARVMRYKCHIRHNSANKLKQLMNSQASHRQPPLILERTQLLCAQTALIRRVETLHCVRPLHRVLRFTYGES